MLPSEDFQRLVQYDYWANCAVLQVLRAIASPPARSVKLLAHIAGTQKLWYERLQQVPTGQVWPEQSLDETARMIEMMYAKWSSFLRQASPFILGRSIAYVNSKGEEFTSRADDILLHVIMHGTYHRAQIAADMRANGHEPAYTDFIHAVRQGHLSTTAGA
jgi:uncharacterized damage-inducible protein DinB